MRRPTSLWTINPDSPVAALNERSREVFRQIVDAYVATGDPVGSRTLARRLGVGLSPATIRNVMADLEEAGLLYAPHISAGRLPTEAGLRLFVDGLLEVGGLAEAERENLETRCAAGGKSLPHVLEQATAALSGLARCAGIVIAPRSERALKHIEFVALGPGRALVVLVTEDGLVENRITEIPLGLPVSALVAASNFLSAKVAGLTLEEARAHIAGELESSRAELDVTAQRLVEAGLAVWTGEDTERTLIVRGQAHLLEDVTAIEDLEHIRRLFEMLETKETMIRLVEATSRGEGIQIYIGAGNPLFGVTGCSAVIAPYLDSRERIVGAIGVIGPTRINYSRIIPLVDYTAKVIGRFVS